VRGGAEGVSRLTSRLSRPSGDSSRLASRVSRPYHPGVPIGWLVVPPLLALAAWLPFVAVLRRGNRVAAALVLAVWTGVLGVGLAALEHRAPGTCARWFPRAAEAREAMVSWARTGLGCESEPICFLVRLAGRAALFGAGTAATGGYLGLLFAAILLGWTGACGGGLAAASARPALAAAAAWTPWDVVRAGAYVVLAVALAEPVVRLGLPRLPGWRRWLVAGLALLGTAALLEVLASSLWWSSAVHPLLR
jgi:hypothetical protein